MRKIYLCLVAFALYFQAGAQTLNQSANWPNPDWTITGSYNTDPVAFESDPLTTANFAFDDDDAGNGHEDNIAAESPVINLTAAHTAGENFISITVDYGYRYLADDVLRFEYWDADASLWMPFGSNIPGNETTINDNFCTITKTTLSTDAINISSFTATQLAGFRYRISYDDKIGAADWNYGFCFDSPTISSAVSGPIANCDAVLTTPADGTTDVSLSGVLTWSAATGVVSGYKLSVGTTSGGTDVLNLFDVGNVLTYDIPGNLNGTTQYFVTITSYNTTSTATGCAEYSFTTLTPPPAPANDDCTNAEMLAVDADLTCPNPVAGTTVGATQSLPGCVGTANDDVWYSFVATQPYQTIMIANTAGNADIVTQVFDSCGGNSIKCQDTPNSPIKLSGLTVGNTYVFRVYTYSSSETTTTSFTVCVGTPPPPPVNDDATGAIELTLDLGTACGPNAITGISNDLTSPSPEVAPTCTTTYSPSVGNGDMWYKVVAPSADFKLNVTDVVGLTTVAGALYSGTPGALTEVGTCGNSWPKAYTGLNVGETYYIRVWDYANDQIGTFSLCGYYLDCTNATATYSTTTDCNNNTFNVVANVTSLGSATSITLTDDQGSGAQSLSAAGQLTFGPYAFGTNVILTTTNDQNALCSITSNTISVVGCPPANDECAAAIALTVDADLTCPNPVAGTTDGATQSLPGCVGTANDDVWYSFVATETYHTIMIANTAGNADIVTQVFDSCGGNSIKCQDTPNSPIELTGLTVGNTYVFRIYTYASSATTTTSFTVCVGTPPPPPLPPANDECAGAIALAIDASFCDGVNNNGDNTGATDSGIANPACFNYGKNDVWFSVAIPSNVATIDVSTDYTGGTNVDTEIELYSGACGSLVQVACDQDSGVTVLSNGFSFNSKITNAAVTAGDTYFVRVSGYNATRVGTFCLEVSTNQVLANTTFESENFKMYPNPVKDILNLSYTKDITNVAVFNLLGQQVITKSVNATQGKIDMSNLSNGTYLVKITADNQVKTIKVIKG